MFWDAHLMPKGSTQEAGDFLRCFKRSWKNAHPAVTWQQESVGKLWGSNAESNA